MSTIPLTPQQVANQEARASREGYAHRVLVAFDIFWNVVSDGQEDETISSRAERDSLKGELLAKILTRGLDLLQPNHGFKAESGDLERSQTIVTTETSALNLPETETK